MSYKKQLVEKISLTLSDLWPGATEQDLYEVVNHLQRKGWQARASSSRSNIGPLLKFSADFHEAMLAQVKRAAAGTERDAQRRVNQALLRRRAELERAVQEREEAERRVEELSQQIDAMLEAAVAFDQAVDEAAGNVIHA